MTDLSLYVFAGVVIGGAVGFIANALLNREAIRDAARQVKTAHELINRCDETFERQQTLIHRQAQMIESQAQALRGNTYTRG